jgi:ATP synthase protein I
MRQAAIAMELPFALVGPVLVGGFLGYWFDRWLGSLPIGMLIGGALGFFAGVREVQRRMKSLSPHRNGSRDQ